MPSRRSPEISARKQPRQSRSTDLVAAILEAAIQVLRAEGAGRFTTARVAERAGVSVGSVYQYFPNKAAILFRLQSDEWRQTSALLQTILADNTTPPAARLHRLTLAFLQSECDEAAMRHALSDAAPLYRDAPEAQDARNASTQAMRCFVHEVWPERADADSERATEIIVATLSGVGKQFSALPRTSEEVQAHADALADMLCASLGLIGHA